MPVTQQENDAYGRFVQQVARDLGIFDLQGETILWHYTDGAGLLGILQSGHINATQVSALNDSKETKYATDLYRKAIDKVLAERQSETDTVSFLRTVLEIVKDEPEGSGQGASKFFVACFSAAKDDQPQWTSYARGHGQYAIGFHPNGLYREPNSSLGRVIYDKDKLNQAVSKIVEATIRFYKEGLNAERASNPGLWAREFFTAWDEWIYKIAPLAKDSKWQSESEYRIVHELKLADFSKVRFSQKQTMLSRYIALDFPCWVKERVSRLPIASFMIGPKGHPSITAVSVRLLLDQMGYINVPIEISTCTWTDR